MRSCRKTLQTASGALLHDEARAQDRLPKIAQHGTQSPSVCGEAWTLDQKATLKAMADQGAKTHRAVGSGGLKHWSPTADRRQHSFSRGTSSVASTTALLPKREPLPPDLSAMRQSKSRTALRMIHARPNVMHRSCGICQA